MKNLDVDVVSDFGEEWTRFDQEGLSNQDRLEMFNSYFRIFPWDDLPPDAIGVDVGCGSGRWAAMTVGRVGHLHLVDPSKKALAVARKNLSGAKNVSFHSISVDALPFPSSSLDFAYSLGVLHHVPDTSAAINSIAQVLRPGAPFLIYLYYAFDNRPLWYRALWKCSDVVRRLICLLPTTLKSGVCDLIAACVYWPIARAGMVLEKVGILPLSWPLAYYRNRSFYVLRTDALDRFGTRLEKRFSRGQIQQLLLEAGLENIEFSEKEPFWCAVGTKRSTGL